MIPPGPRSTILVVSESPTIIGGVEELLRTDAGLEATCASSCEEAGRIASSSRPDLVICQCGSRPECPGTCKAIRDDEGLPAPLFLLVSQQLEPTEIARCLEQGADDYVEMSLSRQLLLPKIHSLLRTRYCQLDLWAEKERLSREHGVLRKNFKEMTSILLKILEIRIPGASDRSETAKAIADFVADGLALDEESRKQVLFAALLHEVGKVGLPDDILSKNPGNLPSGLVPAYQQYTTVGSMIVSTITGYKESADAIYHQLENYDGTGFPAELMGEEIPIGARILRAVVFVEELHAGGCSVEAIVEKIRVSMHAVLDQRIANLLIEFLLAKSGRVDGDKIKIPVEKLVPGMEIAQDVYAASGVKLLPKGVQLHEKMLALLLERHVTDPIIGGVYVLTTRS